MRRLATLLTLLALSAVASACGGDDSPEPVRLSDPGDSAAVTGDEAADELAGPREGKRRAKRRGRARGEAGADGGSRAPRAGRGSSEPGGGGSGESAKESPPRGGGFTPEDAARGNERAQALQRELNEAKAAVREIIERISRSDGSVCSDRFTQRYVEAVTGRRGADAVAKCRSDISRSRGRVELTAFGPSTIENDRASVKFNLRAGDRVTDEEYLMLRGEDDRWRLDEAR